MANNNEANAVNYFLPGYAGQFTGDEQAAYEQKAPLFNLYSPRLFGAPPQFTHQCDMRLKSSLGSKPGPVGDWYLDYILRDAQIANFIIGHAVFNGGMSSLLSMIRHAIIYSKALKRYHVYNADGLNVANGAAFDKAEYTKFSQESYQEEIGADEDTITSMKTAEELGFEEGDNSYLLDVDTITESSTIINAICEMFGNLSVLTLPFKESFATQQAFYTFEADWNSYINNVKMMINTAIMMLGLSEAKVRIGDALYSMTSNVVVSKDNDLWTNYRFITPTANNKVGDVNAIDTLSGETNQYVSFMVEPTQISESYTNTTGESTIYSSVIQSGNAIGDEIAFLTNTSRNGVDDALLNLSGDAINVAERIMSSLTLGTGRFTAAVLGSMARSYTGDHTIFPKIFKTHSSTQSVTLNIKLRASAGDPYSYLMEILVPIFHLMAMAIPQMAKNAASAYSYPPLVQVNIPGVWGTKLGIVQSLTVTKSSTDLSVNGYPLSVDVSVVVEDLQHVIMSSGMDKQSQMLNNDTMFDYIAQCAGVDKYRCNPAMRIVTKIALAASAGKNKFHNLGTAFLNDCTSVINKMTGVKNI